LNLLRLFARSCTSASKSLPLMPMPACTEPHVAAGIDAGAADSLADLLDETRLEPIDIGIGEESVDALVGRDVLHEVVDHGRNGAIAAKPIIERSRLGKRAASSKHKSEQRDGNGERANSKRHGGSSRGGWRFQRLRRRKAPPERRYGATEKTVSPPGPKFRAPHIEGKG